MPLYEDDDVRIELSDKRSSTCVITFTALNEHERAFGRTLFDREAISGIYFIAKWNHWWQPAGCRAGAAMVVDALASLAPRTIMTYGSSMGAYGAALFSGRFHADRALMMAPQFSIDPAKPPHETRWAREAKRITFVDDDMAASISQGATKYIAYDPAEDGAHVDLYANAANTIRMPTPFGGHVISHFLLQTELLTRLVRETVAGTTNPGAFRQLVRARRPMAGNYWHKLGLGSRRRRPGLALDCLRRAVTLKTDDAVITLDLGNALIAAARYVEAIPVLRNAARLEPNSPAPWRALSIAERQRGEFGASVRCAEQALARRDSPDLQRVLVLALMFKGDLARADAVLGELERQVPDSVDTLRVRQRLERSMATAR